MARSLKYLIRGKHGALERHHLLCSDEVISPDVDNMALKTLEWRTVVEKTLLKPQPPVQL